MTVENRRKFLETVDGLVNGDRNVQYGEPIDDFKATAMMLSGFLGIPIQPWQVAIIQNIVKISRVRTSPTKDDHWLDIDGYGATGFDVKDYVIEYPPNFFSPSKVEDAGNGLPADVQDGHEALGGATAVGGSGTTREGDQQV